MERQIVECVAAGLRRMVSSPDYLLYCGEAADVSDTICGLPVLHASIPFLKNSSTDVNIPFIPVWNQQELIGTNEFAQKRFNDGYEQEMKPWK